MDVGAARLHGVGEDGLQDFTGEGRRGQDAQRTPTMSSAKGKASNRTI